MTRKYNGRDTAAFAINRLRRRFAVLFGRLGIYRMLKRIAEYLSKGGRL